MTRILLSDEAPSDIAGYGNGYGDGYDIVADRIASRSGGAFARYSLRRTAQ